jgi:hypothetical protein
MQQAQSQLGQGRSHAAQSSMKQASRLLTDAAKQLARGNEPGKGPAQPGQPSQPGQKPQDRGTGAGVAKAGDPDTGKIDPTSKKFTGTRWGELSGPLQTKMLQELIARYGPDNAEIIKQYYEDLAAGKKP